MKAPAPKSLRTAIQVLVFQDGLTSRSFEIPMTWITKLGWYFGGSLLVTILSVSTALHYWRLSHRAQPERLRELEQQIQLLGEAKLKAAVPSSVAVTSPNPSPAVSLIPAAATLTPPPPVVCAPPSAPAPARASAPISSPASCTTDASLVGFRSFSPAVVGEVPLIARPSIPLEISSPVTQWQGRKLKLQFDIRFTGNEGENQQGRIIVLARGPDVLLSYPRGAVETFDSPQLFDPEKGEFFSVSRYRQTKVEFPAVDSTIQTAEILLFGAAPDGKQKLLMREILKVPPMRGGAREAAAPEEN